MVTSLSSKNLTRGYCTVFKSVYCLNFIVLFIGLKKACGRKLTVLYNVSLFFRSYMSRKRSILLYTILHIMFLARALNIINSNNHSNRQITLDSVSHLVIPASLIILIVFVFCLKLSNGAV